jgi:AcrR family transcriptional regulator
MGDSPRAADTRARLLAGAVELVRAGGVDALTLRALGDHCGLSRGAPYRHFEDKDALVRALAAAGLRELTRRMARSARTTKGRGSPLRRAMEAYVRWATANPDWYRLTFQHKAATHAAGGNDPDLEDAAQVMLAFVTGLVAEAQASGDVPPGDPKQVVGILWAALHGAVDLHNAGHAKPDFDADLPRQVIDALTDLMGSSRVDPSNGRRGGARPPR